MTEYAREWEEYGKIEFEFVSNHAQSADITIQTEPTSVYPHGVYQSVIGPDSAGSKPSMWLIFAPQAPDGEIRRVVLHEFGHALGLIHEHQRPKSGINWNVQRAYSEYGKIAGWDKATVQEQIIDAYPKTLLLESPVDFRSIMIYPIPKGAAVDLVVGWNRDLSPMDKSFINKLYPLDAPPLSSRDVAADGKLVEGEIAQAGQVASYRFSVPKSGTYEVTATGLTPVLLSVFGSNRIGTANKPGAAEGMNAHVEVELDSENPPIGAYPKGTYIVEFRHRAPRTGYGKFSFSVCPTR